MLGTSARYVTMIRDPADTLESHYGFYDMEQSKKMNFSTYVHSLDKKDDKLRRAALPQINTQIKMLGPGMETGDELDDKESVDAFIQQVDRHFHLVMLNDRFDESLVLLADTLCWDLKDVVTLSLNGRKKSLKVGISQVYFLFE